MAKRTSISLTLIRCGETTWDAQGRVHGTTDLPLSDAGRLALINEVKRWGTVKAASIHHPPDEAATDTAKLFAATATKLRAVDELADPNLGLLEGLTEQEFSERFRSRYKQWKEDPATLSAPEGDDMPQAAERIYKTVAKILARSRSDEVAVVLHDLGLSMLRCWLADRPLSSMREMDDRPCFERFIVPAGLLTSLEKASKVIAPAS